MLVVDLLHEFELGVFKYVFKHLIRLLYAINHESVALLNERYAFISTAASTDADDPSMLSFHSISSFGKGAIRRFPSNVSDVKQRAARHFEDVLQVSLILAAVLFLNLVVIQCAIPAFEGLFPDSHDEVVRILLFRLAEWHALAKLRIHTDDSLDLLSRATRCLGQQLRKFRDSTCSAFRTMELPREIAARQKKSSNSADAGTGPSGARPKAFNIQTYKLHALGDYVSSIKMFGTTDSYTTQIVCMRLHRVASKQLNL